VADVNEKVMTMVEKEIARAPGTSTTELHELAKKVDPTMKDLSVRQFHARYPLQVKRKKSLGKGGGRRKKSGSGDTKKRRGLRGRALGGRSGAATRSSEVHAVLIEFAKEVSAANDRGPTAMLDVISNLDGWVARIEKARS
jgi:hypothetical protein